MDKHSGCDCILSTTIIIFDRLRSTAKELAVLLFFQEYVLMMPRAISFLELQRSMACFSM